VMFILNLPKSEKAEPLKCCVSNCSQNAMNVKSTSDLLLLELIPLFQRFTKPAPKPKMTLL
jgi:hypothetical protein